MTHGSLFSGIGGFDLAAEWMGWENVFHCEWNEFGQSVLKHYWPKAISYEDITKTDFNIHRGRIDILTGGFPCQPYSQAGKRLGKEDDRHLWPEMLRAIREIQPTWVVGENVLGIVDWNGGLVFDEVQADLEAEGYEVQPYVLPAASVGAPHRRYRVWFVAKNTHSDGRGGELREKEPGFREQRNACAGDNERISSNDDQTRSTPHANNTRTSQHLRTNGERAKENKGREGQSQPKFRENGGDGNAPHAECSRPSGKEHREKESRFNTETYQRCGWRDFPIEPPVCSRDDGFSSRLDGITFPKWRNESIKAYGNAIVPQVAYQIFKAISKT